MNKEEWRDVFGYEGFYMISSLGIVRSVARIDSRNHTRKGITLNPRSNNAGYLTVVLHKDGVKKSSFIHRLLMAAFVGPSNLCVDHINGNKEDNMLDNLEYVTHRENTRRYFSYRRNPVGVHEVGNRFKVMKSFGNNSYYLGVYDDAHEAESVYLSISEAESKELVRKRKEIVHGKYRGVNPTNSGKWWGKYSVKGVQYCTPRMDGKNNALLALVEMKRANGHAE